jgi:hypothetical protein
MILLLASIMPEPAMKVLNGVEAGSATGWAIGKGWLPLNTIYEANSRPLAEMAGRM